MAQRTTDELEERSTRGQIAALALAHVADEVARQRDRVILSMVSDLRNGTQTTEKLWAAAGRLTALSDLTSTFSTSIKQATRARRELHGTPSE